MSISEEKILTFSEESVGGRGLPVYRAGVSDEGSIYTQSDESSH